MRLNTQTAYTFDDVLLVPKHSNIVSRKDVSLRAKLTRDTHLDIPILSANMDTVTEAAMMIAMRKAGGLGVLHRFMTQKHMIHIVRDLFKRVDHAHLPLAVSVGVNEYPAELIQYLRENEVFSTTLFFVDIAHGDCDRVLNLIKRLKDEGAQVVAGNVATPGATERLINAGADAVKIGIGPGSMCTTRLVTGFGVPQLTAIMECAYIADCYDIPTIADGGIRHSGDIVKALAAGASTVMIGSLLAGTLETPGEVVGRVGSKSDVDKFKSYRGMASRDAMMGWKNDGETAPEGESVLVPYKGSVSKILSDLTGGVRSGMSYCGAQTIDELFREAEFRLVSGSTVIENKAHGKD